MSPFLHALKRSLFGSSSELHSNDVPADSGGNTGVACGEPRAVKLLQLVNGDPTAVERVPWP